MYSFKNYFTNEQKQHKRKKERTLIRQNWTFVSFSAVNSLLLFSWIPVGRIWAQITFRVIVDLLNFGSSLSTFFQYWIDHICNEFINQAGEVEDSSFDVNHQIFKDTGLLERLVSRSCKIAKFYKSFFLALFRFWWPLSLANKNYQYSSRNFSSEEKPPGFFLDYRLIFLIL